jgi:hypothetical protein
MKSQIPEEENSQTHYCEKSKTLSQKKKKKILGYFI